MISTPSAGASWRELADRLTTALHPLAAPLAITFLAEDKLGFWEVRGYSNTADPWTEDRYA